MRTSKTPNVGASRARRPARFWADVLILVFLVSTVVGLIASAGCGGGKGGGNFTPTIANTTGRATVTMRWPERTRLIPAAAESIRVTVLQNNVPLESRLLTRPSGNGSVSASAEFALLPTGNLAFRAEAFPVADGSGVVQARGEVAAVIAPDTVTPVRLTLASTITQISVTPATPPTLTVGETTTLTATAKNADDEVVLTGLGTWQWASKNLAVATVDATTGLVTVVGVGTVIIEARETESGKTHQITLQTAAVPTTQITTTPTLFPAFDPEVTDYVVPAGAGADLQVNVSAISGTQVSVDDQPFQGQNFTATVNNLGAGQRFSFVVSTPNGSRTYHVRRLPSDFPMWTTDRPGTPQAEFYVFAPNLVNDPRHYTIIADNRGTPVWWFKKDYKPVDSKILSNGNVAWFSFATFPTVGEERTFDAALVRNFATPASVGGDIDNHELLLLPNGNYIFPVNIHRAGVDLTALGGPANGTVLDHVLVEMAPDGTVVWQWSTMDHVSLAECQPQWRQQYITNTNPADPYHINSIEPDGDGYIVSMRHMDAVFRVSKTTNQITWKLGGTTTPQSLTFVGDRYGNIGGQHDARLLADGTLTLHDNGTRLNRPPRAVRYQLDLNARTATLLEDVTDAAAPTSFCCGSARRLPGGNWVTEWGANPMVTELAPNGDLVLRLRFEGSSFSYRVDPVIPGVINRANLRNGMDTQYPR